MQSGYFDILGISKQAGLEEIKKAYRQKAKQLHPDLNNSPDAKEQFVELKKAFEYASRYIEWHKGLHDHVYHTGKNSTTYQSETDFKFSGYRNYFHSDFQKKEKHHTRNYSKKKEIDAAKTILARTISIFFYTCLFVIGIFIIIYPLYTTLHNGIDPDNSLASTITAIIFTMIMGFAYVITVIHSVLKFKPGH